MLLRPGAYNEVLTINKAVTLRTPRTGAVAIGASVVTAPASALSPEEVEAALAKWPGIAGQGVGERLGFPGADRE